MSVVRKVSVGSIPLTADVSVTQTHHGSVVLGGMAASGSPVVCTREHDCPELSHTETVNLPVALVVVVVHGLGVLMVGKGGV